MAAANLIDFQNIFSLDGKVAVITGGSRGLGLSAASGMLQAGASKVYITGRSASACEEACAVLNKLTSKRPGAQAIAVPADCSTLSGVQNLVDVINDTTDYVDILVANAGGTVAASIEDTSEKDFDQVMDLNLKSVFFLVQRSGSPSLSSKARADETSVAGSFIFSQPALHLLALHGSS
jgi:NAD(P)-dependent dehydrogenase (short-subunit alcohol dehydrogenase family)